MSRKIEFRIWDRVNKKMNPHTMGYLSQYGDFLVDLDPTGINMNGSVKIGFRYNQYQFAGICLDKKDYDGNLIYEGDIVTFSKGYVDDSWTDYEQNKPFVIEWVSTEGYIGFYAKRENKFLIPCSGQMGTYKWTWRVIGNIHENPELL